MLRLINLKDDNLVSTISLVEKELENETDSADNSIEE